jgi:hypothetical protein
MKPKLTAEYFRKLYKYEPLTGKIISNHVGYKTFFGQFVSLSPSTGGYLRAWIAGQSYLVHRLAILYMAGEFPAAGIEVDHINRDPADNRWENLRLVSRAQNMMNVGLPSKNTSGVKGVRYKSETGAWNARITVQGRYIGLGDHATKEAAIAARKIAEAKYHGEYAFQG